MVGRHGQVVVIGVCMESDSIYPLSCVMKEVQINFALAYTRGEFQETIDALSNGTIDATPMITDVINVDEVPDDVHGAKAPRHPRQSDGGIPALIVASPFERGRASGAGEGTCIQLDALDVGLGLRIQLDASALTRQPT